MGNSSTTGNTSSGHRSADVLQDYGPLPTLLTSNAHNVNGFLQLLRDDGSSVLKKEDPNSVRLVAEKKEEEKQAEADTERKGFVDGACVEYYSKSYGEWVPAIIGGVRPNGCLKLLHDDGSVLKKEADPNSVCLARDHAKQGYDNQAKFKPSFSDHTLGMCSRAASTPSSMEQANAKQSSRGASGSKEACDERMKLLHGLSEKCNAQLKVHRGLSEGMVQDQQLELSHLEFRHGLSKALGPDMANAMHSSDELMRQMHFRHGLSSMYVQQLKLDRSLSEGMGSQAI
jgi:hypothetical protein